MPMTLVLTRKPNDLFAYHGRNSGLMGRFGTLLVFTGERITGVEILGRDVQGAGFVDVPSGRLELESSGEVMEVARYTTIERMGGFVQLRPQRKPYTLRFEPNNSEVAKLHHGGRCYRVHGGHTEKERNILIHEAPHVGWLTGCIGPRLLHDRKMDTQSCQWAMIDLIRHVGVRGADFFVLDW